MQKRRPFSTFRAFALSCSYLGLRKVGAVMPMRDCLLLVFLTATLVVCGGCPPPSDTGPQPGDSTPEGTTGEKAETGEVVFGDLVKPFDPPTLEELDARAEWIDQPVLDSLVLLGERQKDEPVLATVEEALALKNTSPEANAKICSAMGRLPQSDDQVNWGAAVFRHTGADLKSTNPLMIDSTTEFDVLGLTGFGLFGFDWNFRPFASRDTVVSWQASNERLCDKVVMRDDLTWSDGKPITAHDLVFSFRVIMSSQVPVPAVRAGTDKIKWIEAYEIGRAS